jgi:hypothetical protein
LPGWTYERGGGGDFSNTQYAAMGLRAAARLGIEIPDAQWMSVIEFARLTRIPTGDAAASVLVHELDPRSHEPRSPFRHVKPDDKVERIGFAYAPGRTYATGSMTCGAIASLAIAREALASRGSPLLTRSLDRELETMMVGGWGWLDRHWEVDVRPRAAQVHWNHEYYLYAMERAGVLNDVKLVGGRDWYFEGAMYLLAHQRGSGAMYTERRFRRVTSKISYWADVRLIHTCFALLFLKRATPPITPPDPKAGGR